MVFALAESPKEAGVIWAGTNDGLVQITRDGGKTWTNVTANIPGTARVGHRVQHRGIAVRRGAAYISVDFHQVNNRDPFIYKTTDYGKTWTAITNGIPHSMLSYAHCIREDPVRQGPAVRRNRKRCSMFPSTTARTGRRCQANLPHAPVYWIAMQEHFHDLVLATYGRGFWILDDLTPLEQLTPQVGRCRRRISSPRATRTASAPRCSRRA